MLTVAAIGYMVDQNEPSCPFLLELDVPHEPTVEQLRDALVAREEAGRLEANRHLLLDQDGKPREGDDLRMIMEDDFPPLLVGRESFYGDLVVGSVDGSEFLFVGLPSRLKTIAEGFPPRQDLGI